MVTRAAATRDGAGGQSEPGRSREPLNETGETEARREDSPSRARRTPPCIVAAVGLKPCVADRRRKHPPKKKKSRKNKHSCSGVASFLVDMRRFRIRRVFVLRVG